MSVRSGTKGASWFCVCLAGWVFRLFLDRERAHHCLVDVSRVEVSVDLLDHAQTAMSEELGELHRVHAAAHRLGRERMPEEVRVHMPCDRGAVGRATEELEDAAGCQRRVLAEGITPGREEDPVAPGVRWPDALIALRRMERETRFELATSSLEG